MTVSRTFTADNYLRFHIQEDSSFRSGLSASIEINSNGVWITQCKVDADLLEDLSESADYAGVFVKHWKRRNGK